ncbi:hypothetical protein QHF89_02830 [Polyangium sorediatum]|uniref:Cupin n=1 Tax=Polyangium sorediatum TaxID=889274 RepID=A0ABT6NJH6_9BACT|nr:hypothetical protein [Polyangium sorediatum]MDI1428402.1 hypothetical protein [Polyangium sorediatum]
MPRPILNLDELQYFPMGHGERFACRVSLVSQQIGAQKLGYNVSIIRPGKRAFPFHAHS